MDNMTQAFILLLAGFVVVFVVLILLIIIVTLYGKIITAIQNKGKKKKTKAEETARKIPKEAVTVETYEDKGDDDGGIPDEIIAVIAAAVDAVYGEKPHKIKKVKKSRNTRSAWSRAGIIDNTRPF